MSEQNNTVSPEQFMLQQLKRNFGERMAEYEEVIATLQTRIAMLQQELDAQESDSGTEAAPEIDAAPSPSAA